MEYIKLILYHQAIIFFIVFLIVLFHLLDHVIAVWEYIINKQFSKTIDKFIAKYTHLEQFLFKQLHFTLKIISEGFPIVEIESNKHV